MAGTAVRVVISICAASEKRGGSINSIINLYAATHVINGENDISLSLLYEREITVTIKDVLYTYI